jgi:hypothetical protein
MADLKSSDALNRLVVRLYRSLLQYAADTAAAESTEQRAIEKVAVRQQAFIARLVDLISRHGDVVDFGSYPDNSELHYVSLDYLLGKLIADEQGLIAELQAALPVLRSDADAAALVTEILTAENENLSRLRELSKSASAACVS